MSSRVVVEFVKSQTVVDAVVAAVEKLEFCRGKK